MAMVVVAGAVARADPWGKVLRWDLYGDINPTSVPKTLKDTHDLVMQRYAIQCTSCVQLVVICAATVPTVSGTCQESERQLTFQKLMKCMFLGDGRIISQVRKNIQRDIQSGLEFAKAGDDFLVIPENQQSNVVLLLKELVKMEYDRATTNGVCRTSMIPNSKMDNFVALLVSTLHHGCPSCDWCDTIKDVNKQVLGANPTQSGWTTKPTPRCATHKVPTDGHGAIFGKNYRNLSDFVRVFAKPDALFDVGCINRTCLKHFKPTNGFTGCGVVDTVLRRDDWLNAPDNFVKVVMAIFNVAAWVMIIIIGVKTPWTIGVWDIPTRQNCNSQGEICELISQHKVWAVITKDLFARHLSGAFIQIGYLFIWCVLYSLFVCVYWDDHQSEIPSTYLVRVARASLLQPSNTIFAFWMRLYYTSLQFMTVVRCTAVLFVIQVWVMGVGICYGHVHQPILHQHFAILALGLLTFWQMGRFVWTVNDLRDITRPPIEWTRTTNVRGASLILTPLTWYTVIANCSPPYKAPNGAFVWRCLSYMAYKPRMVVLCGAFFHFWLCGMGKCDRTQKAVWKGWGTDARKYFWSLSTIFDFWYLLLCSFIYHSSHLQINAYEETNFNAFCRNKVILDKVMLDSAFANFVVILVVLLCLHMYIPMVGWELKVLAAQYYYVNKLCFDASQMDKLCQPKWNPLDGILLPDYGHEYAANHFMPFLVPFTQLQAIICVFIICMHILFIGGAVITRRTV